MAQSPTPGSGGHADPVQAVATAQPLEVACDESGSDGENLIGGNTDVFAHAGVQLTSESAADHIQEIRNRVRSPAQEYKANHLLREKHRPVLTWLLGPSGPIHGNAHVHLTDKQFFVVGRVVDLLIGEAEHATSASPGQDQRAKAMVVTLYREGQRTFGSEQWRDFLEASIGLMRAKNRWDVKTPVDSFFRVVDVLCLAGAGDRIGEIMELMRQARPRAEAFRAQIFDNPKMIPALDPMIPAIVQTVAYWGEGGRPVSIVHDRQNALTEERIAWLKEVFGKPHPAHLASSPRGRLTSLTFVDSRSDPRVQLADFLAGVARKIASDELNHRGDAELTALLRPYVDSFSIWGDDRSWSLLGPAFTGDPSS
ncbi:DUF3800 domain-containing protein [Streptomyces sp. H10-C2]|uniref:DUF3800 domain-containing protein n=1 Tax=unclassified Streptomyces TaxID=2593676 RepID=UPI0024B959D1|nr:MULTISPECIES: DUF3800 domain-containing protein [unclassified Streptomyces]MDJ0346202.1 DUF3800 domain-containing protein [Streptomyces sp. PH10-H1]MDJ0371153.1 DUF3800 domain-containing protein [Streptomyces sp. H10-C2]